MYRKGYGIIETLAPLHVGATAGEETGNLNLIFRDQFTQTGIIPGSSIRGRLRSQLYLSGEETRAEDWYGRPAQRDRDIQFESRIKIEQASLLWLPVFCPGQPIVWVSCPRLLRRYQRIVGNLQQNNPNNIPKPYTSSKALKGRELTTKKSAKKSRWPRSVLLQLWVCHRKETPRRLIPLVPPRYPVKRRRHQQPARPGGGG
ncbi:RAMP superfamily CRISPR-associated protein [Phormidium sp. CCY1219]|uniref:RAMP superfamily CRISPR-associated protein n=1 Tax=Phormidium sp. CCY1219 TaxID=2886104 RepID=UPI002D1E89FB|nr:RAMP superfamily CRISPR-associated protein [Phormidium sp. CCY1219]MEB3827779.1 RAMP superfamily CRISPR-associated protein [Phormidium sp. CCY1219]